MNTQDWERVKQVSGEALQLPAERGEAFIRSELRDRPDLIAEALSLVGGAASLDDAFLEPIPCRLSDFLDLASPEEPRFTAGQILCERFEIRRYVASGGMGDVYEAWDSELREVVALKTIRTLNALSPEAVEQFKDEVREARRVAHENVCNVHDLYCHEDETGRDVWFLSMEFLAGETLADYLRSNGPVSRAMALSIVKDIAAGLAAAHKLQLVHRDLKPSNVMLVQPDGVNSPARAIVMDFGIARTFREGKAEDTRAQGTISYMSPEQARGLPLKPSCDFYALGVVICELLGDEKPPPSYPDSHADNNVPWLQGFFRRHKIESRWKEALTRCLEANPAKRIANADDLFAILERPSRLVRNIAVGLLASAVVALTIAYALSFQDRIVDTRQLTPGTDLAGAPSITPDGKTIAYSSDGGEPGNLDVWVRALPDGTPLRITHDPAADDDAGISPDGKHVAYRSERNGGGVYMADTETGIERLVAPGGRRPRYSPDGRWIAYWTGNEDESVASGQIFLIPAAGGPPKRLAPDFPDARSPTWRRQDGLVIFQGCRHLETSLTQCSDWWIAQPDGARLVPTGALPRIRNAEITPHVDADAWDGDKVFFGGRKGITEGIWEISLDRTSFAVTGNPVEITKPLTAEISQIDPSLASDGLLVFGHLSGVTHIWIAPLDSPHANAIKVTGVVSSDSCPRVNREGTRLVFARRDSTNGVRDIWAKDLRSGNETVLVRSKAHKYWPIVDDDTGILVYEERGGDAPGLYSKLPGRSPRLVCKSCSNPMAWLSGSHSIFYITAEGNVGLLNIETAERKIAVPSPVGTSIEDADWSPATGRLLFTLARRTDRLKRIYAIHYPAKTDEIEELWSPINSDPERVDRPRWSYDGRSIYYSSGRDGNYCVWGRGLPTERSPASTPEPFEVHHFHDSRATPGQMVFELYGMGVTANFIFFNLSETAGSIWSGRIIRSPSALLGL